MPEGSLLQMGNLILLFLTLELIIYVCESLTGMKSKQGNCTGTCSWRNKTNIQIIGISKNRLVALS